MLGIQNSSFHMLLGPKFHEDKRSSFGTSPYIVLHLAVGLCPLITFVIN